MAYADKLTWAALHILKYVWDGLQIRNYDVYRMFDGSYEQENTYRIINNRIMNGYKYGTHDRYKDGRHIYIFT